MHGPAPQDRPAAPRPVSPFVRAIREQRAAAERAARERIERERNGAPPENAPHWSQIVHEVAKKHGLTYRDLMSRSRFREIVTARNEAFYRIRNEVLVLGEQISFPAIGRRFGGMDHTSVLHGYRKHKAILASQAKASVSPTINSSSRDPGVDRKRRLNTCPEAAHAAALSTG